MSDHITVAVDGMGGDNAPEVIVRGIEITCRADSKVKFLLYGDQEKIEPLLSKSHYAQEFCELIHTNEQVTNDDKPTFALRNRTKSSMRFDFPHHIFVDFRFNSRSIIMINFLTKISRLACR